MFETGTLTSLEICHVDWAPSQQAPGILLSPPPQGYKCEAPPLVFYLGSGILTQVLSACKASCLELSPQTPGLAAQDTKAKLESAPGSGGAQSARQEGCTELLSWWGQLTHDSLYFSLLGAFFLVCHHCEHFKVGGKRADSLPPSNNSERNHSKGDVVWSPAGESQKGTALPNAGNHVSQPV